MATMPRVSRGSGSSCGYALIADGCVGSLMSSGVRGPAAPPDPASAAVVPLRSLHGAGSGDADRETGIRAFGSVVGGPPSLLPPASARQVSPAFHSLGEGRGPGPTPLLPAWTKLARSERRLAGEAGIRTSRTRIGTSDSAEQVAADCECRASF